MTLIQFDDTSGRRIGDAVRFVEEQTNKRKPLAYSPVLETNRGGRGVSLTLATFKGAWAIGESRTVTLAGSTVTASVLNLCQPSRGNGAASLNVVFAKSSAGYNVVEIDPGQTTSVCGNIQGPDLIRVTFQSNLGFGGEARVLSPGGSTANAGPIQTLQLIDGGTKYARLGRAEPSVQITGSATGASFSAVMGKTTDSLSLPVWQIQSATVKANNATGYADGERLKVAPLGGAVEMQPAVLTLSTTRLQPTLAAQPQSEYGFGASVAVSLSASTDTAGKQVWSVSSFSISSGGSAYSVGEWVKVAAAEPNVRMVEGASGVVSKVGTGGNITDISVSRAGGYYKETPSSVAAEFGGRYYLEDKALPPHTASVSTIITQFAPSSGTGASITPTIETNVESPNFGKVVSVSVANGGTGYLAWTYTPTLVFGGADLTQIADFKAGAVQVLGHTGANCLKWYSVTTCATATASP